jgi:hypothetical protein
MYATVDHLGTPRLWTDATAVSSVRNFPTVPLSLRQT